MPKILIVDDLQDNRYLLETLFRGSGYETALAENGAVALRILRGAPVDVIITDILMPVMDGFTLCRECKNDAALRTIPFVFYTATYTDLRDEAFALSLGADRFLTKPQEPEVLLAVAREVLQDESAGEHRRQAGPLGAEREFFRQHNAALFKKLEDKVADLEREVAERQAANERIRAQAELLDLAQDAILVRNMSGGIEYWNRGCERLTGWTAAEAIGRPINELLQPDRTAFERATRTLLADGQWMGELALTTREGLALTVMSRWTLVRDQGGQPRAVLTTNTDITEQKKLQAEFLQAQKMEVVGQLGGGIAHDFNNLLTVINGTAELVLNDLEKDDRRRGDLEEIRRAGDRAAALTQQLLAFSRKQIMKPGVLNLTALVADMRGMLQRLIGEHIKLVVATRRYRLRAGRSRAPPAGDHESRRQREGCHAGWRHADDRDRRGRVRRPPRGGASIASPGAARRAHGDRHRRRNGRGNSTPNLRAVLHDQGAWTRNGPRPFHGLRHRQTEQRQHLGGQRTQQGHDIHHPPAAGRCDGERRPARSAQPPAKGH